MGARRLLVLALAALLVAACGDDGGSSSGGGELFGDRGESGGTGAAASGVLLRAPAGTPEATLAQAADVVRARLIRMGVADATVTAATDGVSVQSSADPYQLHAAAQHDATELVPVTSTALGPCQGPGAPSVGPAARCYVLGPPATGVAALSGVTSEPIAGAGWRVTFSIDPAQYQSFRAAIPATGTEPVAVVADGAVVLPFGPGVPALQSAIGPPLTEESARLAAAALTVSDDLPVALEAPALPPPQGARVDLDFWTAALGVHICGTWLANAPSVGTETGVHSHGDGLVYVHPFNADEAGERANLGLFLERGSWAASADTLELWDGDEHRSGGSCPGGGPAQVRWWVDGVEQQGNPSDFQPRAGQAIVLGFDSDPAFPGPPPQLASLFVPPISAVG